MTKILASKIHTASRDEIQIGQTTTGIPWIIPSILLICWLIFQSFILERQDILDLLEEKIYSNLQESDDMMASGVINDEV